MFCFKKQQRLKKRAEYDLVFKAGNKIITTAFVVYHLKPEYTHARLGLALSKKAMSRASDRNRMKRAIRESFRYEREKLPLIDVVFVARQGLLKLKKADIKENLQYIWKKLEHIYGG